MELQCIIHNAKSTAEFGGMLVQVQFYNYFTNGDLNTKDVLRNQFPVKFVQPEMESINDKYLIMKV